MMTVAIGALINIVLDPILIFGLNLGVKGAALATLTAQAVSAAWVLKFLFGNKSILKIRKKNLKLDKKIILHGVVQNPYPYIKNCDCLISSSFYEGYPRVINEAIALGKLCIGTNVTGTKEALHDGKLGLLVEDSTKGLVDGMNEVINNKKIEKKYAIEINKFDGNKKVFFEAFEKLCTPKHNLGGKK